MLRRFVSMRGLCKVMTGIDRSLWPNQATVMPLRTVAHCGGANEKKTVTTNLSACKKTPPPPGEEIPPPKGVAGLMEKLRDNAAEYEKCFSKSDLKEADALFAKYSQSRKEHVWTPRCDKAWAPKKGTPQEFVGFWLIRQYPSLRGSVRNSMLNGADADLLAAVACEFGVPLEHIECRVVYFYMEGQGSASNVHADFVKGVDGMKKARKGDSSVKGLRWDDGGRQYDLMYGREYRRVAIVGGSRQCDAEEVGQFHGNEATMPIYRYRDTYMYFHVKYLKDYLTHQGASGGKVCGAQTASVANVVAPAQTKEVVALQKYL